MPEARRPQSEPPDAGADVVVLEMPPRPDQLLLARLVTASIAEALDFDFETCEDLRLGVDELCSALLDGIEPAGPLRLEVTSRGNVLSVQGTVAVVDGPSEVALDAIATEIVKAVTDGLELSSDGSHRTFRFEKHVEQHVTQ